MKKFLYQPLKPFSINQKFGENRACYRKVNDKYEILMCDGFNPPVGYTSLYGAKGHLGVDLASTHAQEVYCAQDGIVSFIDANIKSGLDVKIQTTFEGKTYTHIYEHLMGYQPQVGDFVRAGQLVGWADNTGYSSGDHLHFELWNEFGQSIDPIPLMENIFAKDALKFTDTLKYLTEQVALLADKIASYLRDRAMKP